MANEKFQNALARIPQKVPPVWFMRQAGRYHSHYQKLRQKHSFEQLCRTPELAAEVAMGPIQDFDFDVAILFSDLLFTLDAFGMGLSYTDSGPQLQWHLRENNINSLGSVDEATGQMEFQKQAMQVTRQMLPSDKSLIGFVGSPWTLFVYATQGTHKGTLSLTKTYLPLFIEFCKKMVPLLRANIQMQLDGGAEVVMLFDTAAGTLSPRAFEQFVLPEVKRLIEPFPGKLGYYTKETHPDHLRDDIFYQGLLAGLGFDHRWNIENCFDRFPRGFVQGNFDQEMLFLDSDSFKQQLREFLRPLAELSPEQRSGWVCGLGHGVLPKTPVENVRYFVNQVREVFD